MCSLHLNPWLCQGKKFNVISILQPALMTKLSILVHDNVEKLFQVKQE